MYFIGRLYFQSHGIILKSFSNQGSMIFLVSFGPNFSDNFSDNFADEVKFSYDTVIHTRGLTLVKYDFS